MAYRPAAALAALLLPLAFGVAAAGQPRTNLLSQWATGSDAVAIAKLGDMFTAAGGKWTATSIAGHTANTIAKLRADVVSGDPPPAVQLKGPEIAEWAGTGATADLDPIAAREHWDTLVEPQLVPVMKPKGVWVAAPMNIHRINWLWASKKALDQAGIVAMPKDWAEFNADCEKLKAAGLIPVAHGSQDWIDATLFENIVYGMNLDLYRKALVGMDMDALRGPDMVAAFAELRKVIGWTDPGIAGREWDAAANLMLNGKADYLCAQKPSANAKHVLIVNSVSVVFFKQKDPDYVAGQDLLAHLIMSKDFQRIFNQAKGSIPARLDIDLSQGFNPCQLMSQQALGDSIKAGTVVLSMSQNMAILQKFRGAMMEVITEFVNTPKESAQDAANKLGDAVEAQM